MHRKRVRLSEASDWPKAIQLSQGESGIKSLERLAIHRLKLRHRTGRNVNDQGLLSVQGLKEVKPGTVGEPGGRTDAEI